MDWVLPVEGDGAADHEIRVLAVVVVARVFSLAVVGAGLVVGSLGTGMVWMEWREVEPGVGRTYSSSVLVDTHG